MSVAGILGSIGKSFETGFGLGAGKGLKAGGFGTMATMGAIGAVAGGTALAAATDGYANPLTGAAAGGVVGAASLPMAGLAVGAVGSGIVGAAKMAPGAAKMAGAGLASVSPYIAGTAAKVGSHAGGALWGVGKRMINFDESADALEAVKFTGPIAGPMAAWKSSMSKTGTLGKLGNKIGANTIAGKGLNIVDKGVRGTANAASGVVMNGKVLLGIGAILEGGKEAMRDVMKTNMGQNMGTQTLTPRIPSYSDNGGATGDLVFAMNANRRG